MNQGAAIILLVVAAIVVLVAARRVLVSVLIGLIISAHFAAIGISWRAGYPAGCLVAIVLELLISRTVFARIKGWDVPGGFWMVGGGLLMYYVPQRLYGGDFWGDSMPGIYVGTWFVHTVAMTLTGQWYAPARSPSGRSGGERMMCSRCGQFGARAGSCPGCGSLL